MNLRHFCRAALLVAALLVMNQNAAAGPLDSYRWKNRLIIASVAPDEARVQTAAALAANRAKFEERDLKVIDVSPGSSRIPGMLRLDFKETSALREELKLTGAETVFVLIGKDGGEKARQRETLQLARWFALIDEMPMRRDEMRREGKGRD